MGMAHVEPGHQRLTARSAISRDNAADTSPADLASHGETGREMAMATAGAGDQGVRRLPSREETLARGRPFPPCGELVIPDLTDEEEPAFLNAIADA